MSVQIWSSINAIEQSWTNQEEKDRQIVLKYPSRHRYVLFLVRNAFLSRAGTELPPLPGRSTCNAYLVLFFQ